MLEEERIVIGAVRGTLEAINLHAGQNTFRIYPLVGPSFVTCYFPKELKEKAKQAVDKYVTVAGKLHYRPPSEFPHELDAEEIEIMPDESELPTLASLRGIVKPSDWKTAEELLEEDRSEANQSP